MRLKEEKSNYNATNILRKVSPIADTVKHVSKKDTKKWCKGKVGVKHNYQPHKRIDLVLYTYITEKCINCGKQTSSTVRLVQ